MSGPETIRRLIGVYDANTTIRGELTYWIGARLGSSHCSLCDITHGVFRERSEWSDCRDGLPVRFDTFHRNDQPDEVSVASGDRALVVVAETGDGVVVLLDPLALAECGGSPQRLVEVLTDAAEGQGVNLRLAGSVEEKFTEPVVSSSNRCVNFHTWQRILR